MDRTFLPWWPTDTAVEPLLLTTLWPLTGAPLRDAEGVLLTEDAAVQMSPAGRLSRLLDAGAADPGSVSLVVDPEALQSAADLADGYQVRRPDGSVEPGTRRREVADWLDSLTAALSAPGADASGSLYAWPDIDAARRGKVLSTALRQRPRIDEATREILGAAAPQLGRPGPRRCRPAQHPGCAGGREGHRGGAQRPSGPPGRADLLHAQRERAPADGRGRPAGPAGRLRPVGDAGPADGHPGRADRGAPGTARPDAGDRDGAPRDPATARDRPRPGLGPARGSRRDGGHGPHRGPLGLADLPGRGTGPRAELTGPGPRCPDARAGGPGAAGRARGPGA